MKPQHKPSSLRSIVIIALALLIGLAWTLAADRVNAAPINPVADTIQPDTRCKDGLWSVGPCPSGYGLPTIEGWKNVTTALNATGTGQRIDVGGGNNDLTDLSTLDPGTLTPGSVVNVFHRPTAYQTKLVITQDGTETNPIIFNGVTDANGNRPHIDFNGATTANMIDGSAQWVAPYGGWVFTYTRDGGTFADPTEWVEIRNFRFTGANQNNTSDGATAYNKGAAALRFNEADNIKLIGNIFEDNGNGVYVHAGNRANNNFTVSGNKFVGNGVVSSFTEHNFYFQVTGTVPFSNIVEGNYFGPLRDGAIGTSSMKHRGTDLVFRYNTVICEERCLDLVELQDALVSHVYDTFTTQEILDRYRTSYVYGNQFIANDVAGHTAGYLIHIGMDTGTANADDQLFNSGSGTGQVMARGYQSPVYFYHNSIYLRSDGQFYHSIFDGDAVSAGISRYTVEIVAANNMIHAVDKASPYDTNLSHLRHTGQVTYQSGNVVFLENMTNSLLYEGRDNGASDDPDITIVGTLTQANAGLDPLYVTPEDIDLENIYLGIAAGSAAKNAAGALLAPMNAYPVLSQPIRASLGSGAESRLGTTSVGAFE